MTVTIVVAGEVWFEESGVTDFTFTSEYLVLYDKEGKEYSVLMKDVDGFIVTDH